MRRWLFMLGGLMVWAAHFSGVYGLASVAAVAGDADGPTARLLIGGFTALCLLTDVVIALIARRALARAHEDLDRFAGGVAVAGAGLSIIAVVWQGLPALIGR
jgi:hypothetical protein